jgi:hypothetical protein
MLHSCFALLTDYVEVALASRNGDCTRANGERWLEEMCRSTPSGSELYEEILFLYRWWKDERPQRIEPWSDDSIWAGHKKEKLDLWAGFQTQTPEYQEAVEKAALLETLHNQEDQEMLTRLVVIRQSIVS